MAAGVSAEEKANASELRSVTAAELYRRGQRPQAAPYEPEGLDILIAETAGAVRENLSDAGLAVLGAPGLVQLADILVREKLDLDALEELLEGNAVNREETILRLVSESLRIYPNEIRRGAEQILSHGKTANPSEEQPVLEQALGDERLFDVELPPGGGDGSDEPVIEITEAKLQSNGPLLFR